MARKWKQFYNNTKGFTFLEVLVSVVILAMIVSPFLGLFVTSAQYTTNSQEIMDATYTGELLLEDLVADDYATLLSEQQSRSAYDEFFVVVECEPSGVHSELVSNQPHCYVHVIYGASSILLVGPDGNSVTASNGTILTLTQSGSDYQITAGPSGSQTILSGSKGSAVPIILIVNTAAKTTTSGIVLTTPSDTRVVYYTTSDRKNDLSASGYYSLNTYEGVDNYSTSMVRTIVSVYRDFPDIEPLCVVEDYLRPHNWP